MEMMNKHQTMYQAVEESSSKFSNNDALWYLNKTYSYAHLINKIHSCANKLVELGYKKDDVITICLPNIPIAIYLFYAINQIGAIANLVHPLMKSAQLLGIMKKTNSKLLFCLDTSYDEFASFEHDDITVIPCSPVLESSLVFKLGYRIQNRKKLNRYGLIEHSSKDKDFLRSKPLLTSERDYLKDSVYLHSGGTTGEPKTIALSSFAINALAAQGADIMGIVDATIHHMLAVLPMFHGFGLCMGIHALICHGGCDMLMPKFDVEQTIEHIEKNRLSFLIGIPVLYESLLQNPHFCGNKLKHLHIAFVGGDFVSKSLLDRFNNRMIEAGSKCRLYEGYGLTETVTVSHVNIEAMHREKSVGKALSNIKTKIIDLETGIDLPRNREGEICISGETLMNGYRFEKEMSDPFIVDSDGVKWIKTGDLGMLDEDDYLYFKQRLKRLVKVNGINVFPSEIENAVCSLKEVYECAAIGVADSKRGNMIKLFVVLDKHLELINIDDRINGIIKDKCGVYALPKEIVYMAKLPKTLLGKIDVKNLN
ncbi:MAG: class I adenylate-forming enzyme family protein [Bacilli bacterium]|jgi:long-chain acyl-CoA synthetase